jgi:hypothetical protein
VSSAKAKAHPADTFNHWEADEVEIMPEEVCTYIWIWHCGHMPWPWFHGIGATLAMAFAMALHLCV